MTAPDLPPSEPSAGPYTVPKADLNQLGVIDRPPRPSVGDVAMLAFLQVTLSALLGLALWVFFDKSWAWYPLVGITIGAVVFAELRKRPRHGSYVSVHRLYLALWSGLSGSAVIVLLLTVRKRPPLLAVKYWWLVVASASLTMGIIAFALSMVGLWLGTRSFVTVLRRWYGVN
jgi:hypothetical protein